MATDLLLHPVTSSQLATFLASPSHALLLVGPKGSGKSTLAEHVAASLLGIASTVKHQYVKVVDAEEGDGIAKVREIRKFLGLKTAGRQEIRRVVIVENVDSLGSDAQNALLKTLEEPPEDTVILITATQKGRVLETIVSRVNTLKILPLTEGVCLSTSGHDQAELKKAYALSGGYAGSFIALLTAGTNHELVQTVTRAKDFLGQTTFGRLSMVDALSKSKEEALELLTGLEMCFHAMLKNSSAKTLPAIHQKLTFVLQAQKSLKNSVNAKLLLSALSVNL